MISNIILFLHLLFIIPRPLDAGGLTGGLTINIDCKSAKGKIFVALYDNEKHFLKEKYALSKKVVDIPQNKKVVIFFDKLALGKYAFAVFHDENNDQKLNTNFFGVPIEGYGFSNDARGIMSAPSFSKSAFTIPQEGYTCKIKLSY